METRELFYEEQLIKYSYFPNDALKRYILKELLKDVQDGFNHKKLICKIIVALGISIDSWESLLFAYRRFKEFQEESELKEASS